MQESCWYPLVGKSSICLISIKLQLKLKVKREAHVHKWSPSYLACAQLFPMITYFAKWLPMHSHPSLTSWRITKVKEVVLSKLYFLSNYFLGPILRNTSSHKLQEPLSNLLEMRHSICACHEFLPFVPRLLFWWSPQNAPFRDKSRYT